MENLRCIVIPEALQTLLYVYPPKFNERALRSLVCHFLMWWLTSGDCGGSKLVEVCLFVTRGLKGVHWLQNRTTSVLDLVLLLDNQTCLFTNLHHFLRSASQLVTIVFSQVCMRLLGQTLIPRIFFMHRVVSHWCTRMNKWFVVLVETSCYSNSCLGLGSKHCMFLLTWMEGVLSDLSSCGSCCQSLISSHGMMVGPLIQIQILVLSHVQSCLVEMTSRQGHSSLVGRTAFTTANTAFQLCCIVNGGAVLKARLLLVL